MTKNNKNIYLLKYKTNMSEDIKLKAFETIELATNYHLNFKINCSKLNLIGREIIHYELLVIPFNLDINKEIYNG